MKLLTTVLILSVFGVNSICGQHQQQQQQPQQQQQQQQPQHIHIVQGYQSQPQQPQQQQQQQQIQQQQQPQQFGERGEHSIIHEQKVAPQYHHGPYVGAESDSHGVIAAGSNSGAGAWQEAASVGSSAWSQGMAIVSEMFVNLGLFQLLLIPAILLTGVYMIWVAYTSPYNAQSHYLVDSVPGHAPGLSSLLGGGGSGWKRSLNTFAYQKIQELTPKVLDAIKEFATKHNNN